VLPGCERRGRGGVEVAGEPNPAGARRVRTARRRLVAGGHASGRRHGGRAPLRRDRAGLGDLRLPRDG